MAAQISAGQNCDWKTVGGWLEEEIYLQKPGVTFLNRWLWKSHWISFSNCKVLFLVTSILLILVQFLLILPYEIYVMILIVCMKAGIHSNCRFVTLCYEFVYLFLLCCEVLVYYLNSSGVSLIQAFYSIW